MCADVLVPRPYFNMIIVERKNHQYMKKNKLAKTEHALIN